NFHVGEPFLLRHFTPHSVPQAYRRNWKKLKGGTHHASFSKNCCCTGLYRGDSNWNDRYRSGARLLRLRLLPAPPAPPTLLRLPRWRRGYVERLPAALDDPRWRL